MSQLGQLEEQGNFKQFFHQSPNGEQQDDTQLKMVQVGKHVIPKCGGTQLIQQSYERINQSIEGVNQDLQELFRVKQQELMDKYMVEMSKAQQRQRDLQESTSEQQLQKKMVEKKKDLQEKREEFLKNALNFSNKCKEFKSTLNRVINTTKDLENEINFLNEQIVYADKHNTKLQSELQQLRGKIQKYELNIHQLENDPQLPNQKKITKDFSEVKKRGASESQNDSLKFQSIGAGGQKSLLQDPMQSNQQMNSQNSKYISPYSLKNLNRFNNSGGAVPDPEDLQKAKEELRKQKEIYEKLNEFLNDPCFIETEFERLFMESVYNVKTKKALQGNNNSSINRESKFPSIGNKQRYDESINNSAAKKQNDSTLDFTNISDFDFNEFAKRQILEDFLQKEEIKRYLYALIFNSNNSNSNNPNSQISNNVEK